MCKLLEIIKEFPKTKYAELIADIHSDLGNIFMSSGMMSSAEEQH